MQTQIIQIGNSLGLRLPKAMLDALALGKSSKIDIQATDGAIVVRPGRAPRDGWSEAFAEQPATPENLWAELPLSEGWDK